MKNKKNILLVLICLCLLSACITNQTVQEESSPDTDAYPASSEEEGYPVTEVIIKADEGYPVSEPDLGYEQGPEFHINLPVSTGDQSVTGTGPAGVPIILIDVSDVGIPLGETTIEDDGTFTFTLDQLLQSGHMIGLQLGDIEGTGLEQSDFLYSETYYERPLIGILFDLVTVE